MLPVLFFIVGPIAENRFGAGCRKESEAASRMERSINGLQHLELRL